VGGHNKVAMAELRALAKDIGLINPQTVLQSGNLVFESAARGAPALEALLEKETAKRFGLAASYLVRSAAEWTKLVAANPYEKETKADPGRLVAILLKDAPASKDCAALKAAIKRREYFHADGRTLYAYYPDGQGESKITAPLIDRILGTTCTARNWNTVLKLAKLAAE
jgi:uncharacterized protein (DUF1697 family)